GLMLAGMSTATHATEWIHCGDAGDKVSLGVLLGGDNFTNPMATTLRIGEEWWTSDPIYAPDAKALLLGDYFFDWKEFNVTVTDEDASAVLAEMRVVVLESDNDIAKGGVLHAPGHGVWPVACEGP